ncbi:Choline/ethanolaminephosphotransferase [Phellopilus nigrolimitatus]|nr:Choline/ethanolaminephosphotransferase [Phellopilus nigrolimitatus]
MHGLLYEPYLEPEALSNLRFYRYSAIDKSLVYNHVIRHWCDLVIKVFPMWMAPNVITLSGFGFIVINVVLLSSFIPTLLGPGPSWVYLSFAIGLFLYQTFDNIDGKQARRTGTSSALGHIFDHTIDSLNCALGGVLQVASLSVGPSAKGFSLVLVGCAAMWFSTWEEYHTGTLYLGYFNGPTEGVLIACTIHLISAMFGPQIWLRTIKSFGVLGLVTPEFHLYDVVVYLAFFSLLVIHIPECIINVYKARRASMQPFLPTLGQHVPFLLFVSLACGWALSPYSHVLSHSVNYTSHKGHAIGGLIEFALLVMFAFGKLGPRVILARLTRSPFPWLNFGAFAPLAIGVVYVNLGVFIDGRVLPFCPSPSLNQI